MISRRSRFRIGLLVPFTNSNLEPDMAAMCPDDVTIYTARMGGYDENAIPDAAQMQGLGDADLEGPLRLLMGVRPDVVMYGCTSATLTHGIAFDQALAARIQSLSGAQTITAAGALVQALQHLGADHIGFASPYVPAINDMAIDFLAKAGVTTVARADMTETLDNEGQGALSPDAVRAHALLADHPKAQALVLSCTDMRSVEVLHRIEAEVGKPVVSSNQAMMFAAQSVLGFDQPIQGYGTLLSGGFG